MNLKSYLLFVLLLDTAVIMFIYLQMNPADLTLTLGDSGGDLPSGDGPGIEPTAGNFTVIVIPDPQHYFGPRHAIFTNQTRWIASQKEPMNIVYAVYTGDLVDDGNSAEMWREANESISVLDGVVPYALVRGNHDLGSDLYNEFFPSKRYEGKPWYGGSFKDNENSYHLFSAGGEYMLLGLDYCPTPDEISWAYDVVRNHSERKVVLFTHAFLNAQGERDPKGCPNTTKVWEDLVRPSGNIFLVVAGHVHGEARRTDNVSGLAVHQVLADYQSRENGGNGWLRIMVFVPSEGRIYVYTYSPYLDRFETDADSQFTLDWKP
jgi:hypothetical protein